MTPEPISRTYRFAMAACAPIVRWWGRLEVEGEEHLPRSGPTLIVGNHDSHWDPVAIGIAGRKRRQIRALAKASLWKIKPLAPILRGMGQIPIDRGKGDSHALDEAVRQLREGACIGVFPEGTISRGTVLRARSGVGRLALAVPEATIVSVTVVGTVDIVRFPKRPQIKVRFFPPAGGGLQDGEDAAGLPVRLMAEIRELAPIAQSGRKRKAALNDAKLREADSEAASAPR
jgi:1-acyl-sn-glycerol-3-phosphate acyltransferase